MKIKNLAFLIIVAVVAVCIGGCSSGKKSHPNPPSPKDGGTNVAGTIFTLVQWPDVHPDFSTSQLYGTNAVPWFLAHTNDGVLNCRIACFPGDSYESQNAWVPSNDPGNLLPQPYHAYMLTNDVRRLRDTGILTFVNDGNHDCDNTNGIAGWCTTSTNLWNNVFPPAFFNTQSFYVTSRFAGDNKQMVMKYTNGHTKLLLVSYHTEPDTNTPALTYLPQSLWISNQIAAYPDHNAIILTHYMLSTNLIPEYSDGSVMYHNIGPGPAPFTHGLQNLSNLCLFLTGHNLALLKGSFLTNGPDGHAIRVCEFNQQAIPSRRNTDFLNLFTFNTALGTVLNRTYCVSLDRYLTNYETASGFTNTTFPNGYPHTWEMSLPIKP